MNNIIVMVFDSLSISTEKVLRNKAKNYQGFVVNIFMPLQCSCVDDSKEMEVWTVLLLRNRPNI